MKLLSQFRAARKDPKSAAREGEGILHQQRNVFTDDELIITPTMEMSTPMLEAARVRINEDEDFAKKYRAFTDYPPVLRGGVKL